MANKRERPCGKWRVALRIGEGPMRGGSILIFHSQNVSAAFRATLELWTESSHSLYILPDDLRLDHAVLIEPVAVACHDVRLSDHQAGEHVVVIGGGPIGVLVAMVAQDSGENVVISEVNPVRL